MLGQQLATVCQTLDLRAGLAHLFGQDAENVNLARLLKADQILGRSNGSGRQRRERITQRCECLTILSRRGLQDLKGRDQILGSHPGSQERTSGAEHLLIVKQGRVREIVKRGERGVCLIRAGGERPDLHLELISLDVCLIARSRECKQSAHDGGDPGSGCHCPSADATDRFEHSQTAGRPTAEALFKLAETAHELVQAATFGALAKSGEVALDLLKACGCAVIGDDADDNGAGRLGHQCLPFRD